MPSKKINNLPVILGTVIVAGGLVAAGWFANSSLAGDFKNYRTADGRTLPLLRRVQDAFPVYAKPFKAEVDLTLGERQKVKGATAGGIYESGVEKLYESLDHINYDVRTSLIAAYSGLILRVAASSSPDRK